MSDEEPNLPFVNILRLRVMVIRRIRRHETHLCHSGFIPRLIETLQLLGAKCLLSEDDISLKSSAGGEWKIRDVAGTFDINCFVLSKIFIGPNACRRAYDCVIFS